MSLAHDLRIGLRAIRKAPGFAATAILTMALGIGATTAVFSVADGMLWKPIPLPHLETLAVVMGGVPDNPRDWNDTTPADVADIRRETASFSSLASFSDGLANIAGAGGEPERVEQALVTANFFDVLGVQPQLGRGTGREVLNGWVVQPWHRQHSSQQKFPKPWRTSAAFLGVLPRCRKAVRCSHSTVESAAAPRGSPQSGHTGSLQNRPTKRTQIPGHCSLGWRNRAEDWRTCTAQQNKGNREEIGNHVTYGSGRVNPCFLCWFPLAGYKVILYGRLASDP